MHACQVAGTPSPRQLCPRRAACWRFRQSKPQFSRVFSPSAWLRGAPRRHRHGRVLDAAARRQGAAAAAAAAAHEVDEPRSPRVGRWSIGHVVHDLCASCTFASRAHAVTGTLGLWGRRASTTCRWRRGRAADALPQHQSEAIASTTVAVMRHFPGVPARQLQEDKRRRSRRSSALSASAAGGGRPARRPVPGHEHARARWPPPPPS